MAADENTNSTKELSNVKTIRPISTKFGTNNLVATIYTLGFSMSEFFNNNKVEELNRHNLNKYVNSSIWRLLAVLLFLPSKAKSTCTFVHFTSSLNLLVAANKLQFTDKQVSRFQ